LTPYAQAHAGFGASWYENHGERLQAAAAIPSMRRRLPADPGGLAAQRRLVDALCEPGRLGKEPVRVIETHISFVLLTGSRAYKIKKGVKYPFLDFSTLAARRSFCDAELRLNRRLAPELYLDVVAITGTARAPRIGGTGPVLDYAVRMQEFPQDALLCNVLDRNELTAELVDALAARVAQFHAGAQRSPSASHFGTPAQVRDSALANFAEILPHVTAPSDRVALRALRRWTRREHAAIHGVLEARRHGGAIRECHGDLHLGNIALIDNKVTIFDCIEFNDTMRWIDTMSEVAFTVMDIEHRGRTHLARRFLSTYLERSGDYAGARVLRFYLVYRALVRAKVAMLRASQMPRGRGRDSLVTECSTYVGLATSYVRDSRPMVVVMHGLSGCGKTTVSQILLERTGALRVRTDVERKRLAGLGPEERGVSAPGTRLYAHDATRQTYDHVRACTAAIVQGGFAALVDGAFLARWQRDLFRDLAAAERVPFLIVDCVASVSTLESRVAARACAGKDASDADLGVLAHQSASEEPLTADERRVAVTCNTEIPWGRALCVNAWREAVERIRVPGQSSCP